jgi:hypothetical protein
MRKLATSNKSKLFIALTLAATLTIVASSKRASASTGFVTGPVSIIEYVQGSLLVQMTSVNYVAQLATATGCTANNVTIDTIKAFQSLAQSALLSGKTLRIYYTTCNSAQYINTMDLNQ